MKHTPMNPLPLPILVAAALSAALLPSLRAQLPGGAAGEKNTSSEQSELPKKFWEASVPGGNFLIALSKISFVSIHEYIVDGNVRVREVCISSDSSAIARFYHLELVAESSGLAGVSTIVNRAQDVASSVAGRTGTEEVWKKVQKNYPTSTHAHTVEYRLEYLDDLQALYGSAKSAWYNGRGAKFTVKSE